MPAASKEKAAQKTAQNDAQGIGHGKIGLSLDPVCGRCHVVDPVDGGHSVQSVSCGFKDLNAIEEEYTGGQPGEQGVEEKGKAGQADPAPAGSPAEQEEKSTMAGMSIRLWRVRRVPISPLPPPRYWTI